jgi:hypothetical protein
MGLRMRCYPVLLEPTRHRIRQLVSRGRRRALEPAPETADRRSEGEGPGWMETVRLCVRATARSLRAGGGSKTGELLQASEKQT